MLNGTLVIELFEASIFNDTSILGKINPRVIFTVNVFKARSSTIQDGGKNPKWKSGEIFSVRSRLEDYLTIELLNEKQIQGSAKIKIEDLPVKKPIWIELSQNEQAQQKKTGKIALQFEFYPDNQQVLTKLENAQLIGNTKFKEYNSSENTEMSVDDLSLEVNKLQDDKANLQQSINKQLNQIKEEQEKLNSVQQSVQQLQQQLQTQDQKIKDQKVDQEQLQTSQTLIINGISGQVEFSNLSGNLVRDVETLGSKMDPYIRFVTSCGEIKSEVLEDAHFTPKWPKGYKVQLQNEKLVYIEIWDKNRTEDKIIGYGWLNLASFSLSNQVQPFELKIYYFKREYAGEFKGNLKIVQQ